VGGWGTTKNKPLTPNLVKAVAQFDRDGVVRIPRVIKPSLVAALTQAALSDLAVLEAEIARRKEEVAKAGGIGGEQHHLAVQLERRDFREIIGVTPV